MIFKLFGIIFELRFSFILIIAFAIIFEIDNLIYVLIFSILHEIGHIFVLYIQRKKADKIVISFNGFGLVHSCSFTFLQELAFLTSGIIVNLLFAVFDVFREINLALFIVNTLPIYPLDGGRVTKLLLNKFLSFNLSDNLFRFISSLFLLLLIALSIYLKNFNLLLISLYSVVYSLNNSFD